ncbi:MAG: lysophospholipid acyltransferase family protein, partial [Lachnospiraceae bacterium]
RIILILFVLILFAIFSLPMYPVQYFIGKKDADKQFRVSQTITKGVFKIILFLAGTKVKVEGIENVPKDEAVLYVSNHRSYFDIIVCYRTVPTLTSFVSKKEFEKIPCLRTWMRYMKCLFLDRENVREGLKTILQGIEQIKEGYSIFIMPEGTRNHEKEMMPFHEGSFKLAEKSGCPIIPVSISHADDIFENHFPWIRKAKVTVCYGTPIYMKTMEKEERKRIGVYTQNRIKEMLEKSI